MTDLHFRDVYTRYLQEIETVLAELWPGEILAEVRDFQQSLRRKKEGEVPPLLERDPHFLMAYTVEAGGKRFRPMLALMVADFLGKSREERQEIYPLLQAVELIHTYSLVHDDLPAMDNDDLRRGYPTSHVLLDEGRAILVGDALLTFAFSRLATLPNREAGMRTLAYLAEKAGAPGMVGGQWIDLQMERRQAPLPVLLDLVRKKTAALLQAPLVGTALYYRASDKVLRILSNFGESLGIAFQIRDDLLDVLENTQTLGKTVGKDAQVGKSTFVTSLGMEGAQRELEHYRQLALESLEDLQSEGNLSPFWGEVCEWLTALPNEEGER